jgi:hypothetical protein
MTRKRALILCLLALILVMLWACAMPGTAPDPGYYPIGLEGG